MNSAKLEADVGEIIFDLWLGVYFFKFQVDCIIELLSDLTHDHFPKFGCKDNLVCKIKFVSVQKSLEQWRYVHRFFCMIEVCLIWYYHIQVKVRKFINFDFIVRCTDVVVAPPFVYIDQVKNTLTDRIEISGQNSWVGKGGAFTGEIRWACFSLLITKY